MRCVDDWTSAYFQPVPFLVADTRFFLCTVQDSASFGVARVAFKRMFTSLLELGTRTAAVSDCCAGEVFVQSEPRQGEITVILKSFFFVSPLMAALAVSASIPALPAMAADPSHAGGSEETAGQLSEVVVTARKRTESLENVPAAISVVSGDAMLQNHDLVLQDYYTTVPGLSITDAGAGGSVSIAIRGLSTGSGGNATVGITIDDVPIGTTNTALISGSGFIPQLDPSDIQRIEVLKGPQGTLYGASSMGGVLRYVTAAPDLRDTSGRVEVDGSAVPGGGRGYGVRGSVNIPLIEDTFAVRVSAFDRHDPGFVNDPSQGKNNVNGTEVSGGRLDSLLSITPDLSIRLAALIQRTEGSDGTVDTNLQYQPISGNLNQTRIPGTGEYSLEYQLFTGTLNYRTPLFDVTNILAYSSLNNYSDSDASNTFGGAAEFIYGVPTSAATILEKSSKFSEELRLSSIAGSKLDWQLGAFYTSENSAPNIGLFYGNEPSTGASIGLLYSYPFAANYDEYAAFGDLTYHVTDRVDVQVGGRESHNHQHFNQDVTGPLEGGESILGVGSHDNSFTYLVTPQLRLSDSIMTYARFASGYQPGGPNTPSTPTAGVPQTFGPSTTTNYELGVKMRLFDRRLSIDADIFYIDWSKIQLTGSTPAGFTYVFNGGKAKSQGAEVSAELRPLDKLTLSAAFAYVDALLTNNVGAGFPGASGDSLPYSSKYSASLSADHRFHVAGSVDGFAGATAAYVGKRYEGFPPLLGAPQPLIPSYTYANVQGGILTHGLTVTAFVKNVTNKLGILSSQAFYPNPNGSIRTAVLTPRTVGLSLEKQF
jgi:iron complex outermembrane receptor protein